MRLVQTYISPRVVGYGLSLLVLLQVRDQDSCSSDQCRVGRGSRA